MVPWIRNLEDLVLAEVSSTPFRRSVTILASAFPTVLARINISKLSGQIWERGHVEESYTSRELEGSLGSSLIYWTQSKVCKIISPGKS